MIIDTHAHLNDRRLLPEVSDIVSSFQKDNLQAVINVGYCRESSEISLNLANKHSNIFASVGIHPHDSAKRTKEDFDFFYKASKNKKVVAIGETGLDYFYNYSEKNEQKTSFIEHLELADSVKLPIIIHLRDATSEMVNILRDNTKYLNSGAVLHCYSGSAEMVKEFLKFGEMYFSFGGAVTFKNTNKEDVIKAVPLDRLLLETDCPYMSPVPFRGQVNYPKYVNLVCQKVQTWLPNINVEDITTKNAKRLFKRLI